MAWARTAWQFTRDVVRDYFEDKAPRLAAALAYYALFAMAPLAIILIAATGLVLGPDEARVAVADQASRYLGPEGGAFVGSMVDRFVEGRTGALGAVLGTILLLVAAGGVIVQLQDALNTVWEVQLDPRQPLLARLRKRLRVYLLVLALAVLLLVSLVLSAIADRLQERLANLPGSDAMWSVVDELLGLALMATVFTLIFKFVPDAHIGWRSAAIGGSVTGVLLLLAQTAVGLYLGRSQATSSYGPAGAVVAILLGVYVGAQVVLLGAEVAQGFARRLGNGITPDHDSIAVTKTERRQQGIA